MTAIKIPNIVLNRSLRTVSLLAAPLAPTNEALKYPDPTCINAHPKKQTRKTGQSSNSYDFNQKEPGKESRLIPPALKAIIYCYLPHRLSEVERSKKTVLGVSRCLVVCRRAARLPYFEAAHSAR
ncbi:hypothetical protein LOAG_07949 [Loa loa]|uniref:Uncharacterized protein n=1 Tax=Loa loa TaxID=7209 RepID=A0A1S0TUJ8_LOALO|nr:hypothetical protein LOAG_07949 [Loa loa]EFO20540.1 hypothetical protein LOAG_07949 [Loa loa]